MASASADDNFPPPSILMRHLTISGPNIDPNWLWKNRYRPELRHEVIEYFFSPTIHDNVKRYLNVGYKRQLLRERRLVKNLVRYLRRNYAIYKRRRVVSMSDALHNTDMVDDVIGMVAQYM